MWFLFCRQEGLDVIGRPSILQCYDFQNECSAYVMCCLFFTSHNISKAIQYFGWTLLGLSSVSSSPSHKSKRFVTLLQYFNSKILSNFSAKTHYFSEVKGIFWCMSFHPLILLAVFSACTCNFWKQTCILSLQALAEKLLGRLTSLTWGFPTPPPQMYLKIWKTKSKIRKLAKIWWMYTEVRLGSWNITGVNPIHKMLQYGYVMSNMVSGECFKSSLEKFSKDKWPYTPTCIFLFKKAGS